MVAAGDPVESTNITTVEDYTIRKPLVRLIQSVVQSIPHDTDTAFTFTAGSEDIDTHGFHDETTNPSRITPSVAGYYLLTFCPGFAAGYRHHPVGSDPREERVGGGAPDPAVMASDGDGEQLSGGTAGYGGVVGERDNRLLRGVRAAHEERCCRVEHDGCGRVILADVRVHVPASAVGAAPVRGVGVGGRVPVVGARPPSLCR
jgi:hypothetical protein